MFGWCQALHSLDLSRWDVSNVVAMQEMFVECIVMVSLDLSNWKMSQVERLEKMFRDCFALKQLDLSGWTLDGGLDYFEMFLYCNLDFQADNQACEITTTQQVQDFLLNRLEVTGMNPLWFIWTNGNVDNGGSSVDDMPNQEW
jgi:surface protein